MKTSASGKIKVDLKQILKDEANWKHPNFGNVASFITGLGEDGVVDYKIKNLSVEKTEEVNSISTSIAQALAEERKRMVKKIQSTEKDFKLGERKWCIDCSKRIIKALSSLDPQSSEKADEINNPRTYID